MVLVLEHILDLIFIAIIAVFALVYWKRGFIQALFGALTTVASLILSFLFGPKLGDLLSERFFFEKLSDRINGVISPIITDTVDGLNLNRFMNEASEGIGKFTDYIEKYGVSLSSLKEKFGSVTVGTEADIRALSDAIAKPAATTISRILGCVIVFIAALIVLWIAKFLLSALFELPGLKQINETFGALLGVVSGVAIVWLVCLAMSAILEYSLLGDGGTVLARMTENSFIFRLLCKWSPLEFLNLKEIFHIGG